MQRAIFAFGEPGAGKTAIVRTLAQRRGLRAIFSSQVLKRAVTDERLEAAVRRSVEKRLTASRPMPVQIYVRVIEHVCTRSPVVGDVIFDGFPRTAEQCLGVERVLDAAGVRDAAIVGLPVRADPARILQRLETRRQRCISCGAETGPDCCSSPMIQPRADDDSATFMRRFSQECSEMGEMVRLFGVRWPLFLIVNDDDIDRSLLQAESAIFTEA